jgi:hypothetical protein
LLACDFPLSFPFLRDFPVFFLSASFSTENGVSAAKKKDLLWHPSLRIATRTVTTQMATRRPAARKRTPAHASEEHFTRPAKSSPPPRGR